MVVRCTTVTARARCCTPLNAQFPTHNPRPKTTRDDLIRILLDKNCFLPSWVLCQCHNNMLTPTSNNWARTNAMMEAMPCARWEARKWSLRQTELKDKMMVVCCITVTARTKCCTLQNAQSRHITHVLKQLGIILFVFYLLKHVLCLLGYFVNITTTRKHQHLTNA